MENYSKIIIASSDTDVLINSIYHCSPWMQADLEELWVVCGEKASQQAVPVHDIITKMDSNVNDILPAVHALTGTIWA